MLYVCPVFSISAGGQPKGLGQEWFFPFLEEKFSHLARRYRERFAESAFLRGAYPEIIRNRLRRVRARQGLAERFPEYQPELWEGEPQMELGL